MSTLKGLVRSKGISPTGALVVNPALRLLS